MIAVRTNYECSSLHLCGVRAEEARNQETEAVKSYGRFGTFACQARHCSKKQFQPFKISSALENPSLKPPRTLVLADQRLTGSSETRRSDPCFPFAPP